MTIDRLIQWVESHVPEIMESFNEPASLDAISATEAKLGVRFPPELRALYSRFNGQKDHMAETGLFYGLQFNSLEMLESDWELWESISRDTYFDEMVGLKSHTPGFVKPRYANPKWIPVSKDGGGNNFGLDFDPGPKGTAGQVINFGRDEDVKFVMADSFAHFIEWYVGQLDKGNFLIVREDGGTSLNTKSPRTEHFLDSLPALFK